MFGRKLTEQLADQAPSAVGIYENSDYMKFWGRKSDGSLMTRAEHDYNQQFAPKPTAEQVAIGRDALRAWSDEQNRRMDIGAGREPEIEDEASRTHTAEEVKEILAEAKRISDEQQFGPHGK
jgi:hypothetical protein